MLEQESIFEIRNENFLASKLKIISPHHIREPMMPSFKNAARDSDLSCQITEMYPLAAFPKTYPT